MRKLLITLIALFTITSLSAQQTVRSDAIGKFNAVSISGDLAVTIIEADTNRMEVVLDDEVDISKFKWGVDKERLSFSLRGRGSGEIKIYYSDPLDRLEVINGTLTATETLIGDYIMVIVSGGGVFKAEFDALEVNLEVTSNSRATVTGEAKYLTARVTERSVIDTRKLYAMSVDVTTATRAEAYVTVEERLLVDARSSSTIFYNGNPIILKDKTSGMSSSVMGSSVIKIGG